jgi:hypothetical protein
MVIVVMGSGTMMGRVLRDMQDHSLGRDRREITVVHQGLTQD